jgi:ammonium transporter, Amt family
MGIGRGPPAPGGRLRVGRIGISAGFSAHRTLDLAWLAGPARRQLLARRRLYRSGRRGHRAHAWRRKRRGKFPKEGLSTAMPGHHVVYVLFGSMLSLVGWLAWNAAGAILWLHAPLSALPVNAINTVLAAAAALLATLIVTRIRFGKPDASLCANGWLAGLVASSGCAAFITPGESIFVGMIAGIATPLLVEMLELALSIDDPSGAITVHGVAGLWGLLAGGLFAPQPGQLLAQLVGIATLLGLVLPLVYLLFAILNRAVPFRVDPDGERIGMDLHELGGGAYPEFVIHRDESYR